MGRIHGDATVTAIGKEFRVFQNVEPHGRGLLPTSLLMLIGFVGLCLLVGAVAGGITEGSVHGWYRTLTAPPGTPPDWLFAPVWSTLYIMIGVSAWLVWRRIGRRPALRIWGWQLLANALWTPAFFGLHSAALGLTVMVPLLVLIGLNIAVFARVHRGAAWLLSPYLLWTCYAAYLNFGFWWLNHV